MSVDPKRPRENMVRELESKGVKDPQTLAAMRRVPRHLFVQEALAAKAYGDHPLPIGHGQTISQPYIVALMTQLLEVEPGMRILEIGTGSGYQTAVLAELGAKVFSVERVPALYEETRLRLAKMYPPGRSGIWLRLDDGTLGWPGETNFDRIIVTAAGPEIPQPLLDLLADPGIMIMPVGQSRRNQRLIKIKRKSGRDAKEEHAAVVFVDLIGEHGW